MRINGENINADKVQTTMTQDKPSQCVQLHRKNPQINHITQQQFVENSKLRKHDSKPFKTAEYHARFTMHASEPAAKN